MFRCVASIFVLGIGVATIISREIVNNFFVDCYSLDSYFVNYSVIYYGSCCYLFVDN